MKRRDIMAAAGAATMAAPLASPARAQRANTLRLVPQANLTALDPIWTTAAVTMNHAYNVFDTLYGVDAALRARPQMAEGHEVSADGRTWLIKLREGLRFHDGEPVRAQDCAPSLRRWAARDTFGQTLGAAVDAFEAADDRTIRIRLKSPFPLLADALAKPNSNIAFIMPERLANTDPMTQVTEMVGSGPYRFLPREFIPGSRVAYEKFQGYVPRQEPPEWGSGGKVAHFERIEWHVIPDPATASAALQNGEVDWWEQALADLLPSLRRNRNITVEITDTAGYTGWGRFNHLHAPFNNPAIRRAVISAINQEDYLRAVTANDPDAFRQCRGFWPCGTPYGADTPAAMPGNLDAARAAIRAAGYNGERVVIINPTDFPTIGPFGQVTHDLFRRLGLNSELVEADWGTVIQRRNSREPVERGGWSVFHTWWPSVSILNPAINAVIRGAGARAWFGWHESARIEELAGQWLAAPDAAAQATIAAAMQQEAFQSVPAMPLGQFFIHTAYRRNLQGVLKGVAPYPWNVRRV
jgi:peptide/nickel transport system substrate-binding protein